MDEEDIADAEEGHKVQTTDSFAGLGSTAEESARNGPVMDIFKTGGETMGVKLLRKMGWRDGQGIGPKVRRKARLDQEDDPGGGCDSEILETHLFAPESSATIAFVRKNDRKGLGFEVESRLGDATVHDQQPNSRLAITGGEDEDIGIGTFPKSSRMKKKKQSARGGIGIGILNDNGSDDEDTYSMGPQISYNRTVGGDKKKKPLTSSRTAANPLLNSKPIFISKKAASTKTASKFRRCHDGRLPLDGFVLSRDPDPLSSIIASDKKYPPPTIPLDWKPAKTVTAKASTKPYLSAADVAKASTLSPKSRAALLGEATLPGKSVFDYLSNNARSRIASATNNSNLPPALNEASSISTSGPSAKSLESLVPQLDPQTALTALGRGTAGWMPYAEDASKRSRYRSFLEIRAGLRGAEPAIPERAPGHSTDDWVNEMKEFAHAAQIFKPMTGMMATRFTSASSAPKLASDRPEQASDPAGSVEGADTLTSRPADKKKDPAEEAASLDMFGPLTRSSQEWYPTRLLCKRFNVKPPVHVDPGGAPAGFEGEAGAALPQRNLELVGKRQMDEIMRESNVGRMGMRDLTGAADRGEAMGAAEGGEAEAVKKEEPKEVVDPERNDALERERPAEELFQAVFGTDSEDD